jgi:hypothetical protein
MKITITSPKFLLGLILLFAFLLRLHNFTSPIADWHSWRQADTSAVSRNFVKSGFDLLHPQFDDISNVASGLDNPNGYRFVEFPIYNLLQAGLFSIIGIFTLEEWGRLVTIFSSLAATTFLFLILKKYAGVSVGLFTAFFYAFIPFNIFYGRVILPDPTMVAATLGGIYFFDRWIEEMAKSKEQRAKSKYGSMLYFILATLFTASALLLKPYAVFFLLPMVYIAWKRYGMKLVLQWQLVVFAVLSILPLILWRQWMVQYPEGIPANQWLLNGNGIRFRPAFFRWMVYERTIKLLSGYYGVIFLGLGMVRVFVTKHTGLYLSFVLGSVLYVTIFATGNVQHDYYQILIMPTLAILYGLGAAFISTAFRKQPLIGMSLVLLISSAAFFMSWKQVKDYFNINNPVIVEVGKVVDAKTPKDARVIALYNGDTSFLYQTNRKGWTSFQNPLPEMITKGADYLIQLDPTPGDITLYETEYEITASSSAYVLVKLR